MFDIINNFGELFTPPESPACNQDFQAANLQKIKTVDHELEAERRRLHGEIHGCS